VSFHLTAAEKRDIALALDNPVNKREFERVRGNYAIRKIA